MGFSAGGGDPGAYWQGLIDGLATPQSLNLAFSIVGDALNLPPILNSMLINAVIGMVGGFLENPEDSITGMFEGMMETFYNSCVRALTLGIFDPETGGWNKNWDGQYWFATLVNFFDIVEDKGIVSALEEYMTGIFTDEAAYEIMKTGGVADFLSGNASMVQEGGEWLKKVQFTDNFNLYLDPDTNEIIGRDYNGVIERGTFGINEFTGKLGLVTGTITEVHDGITFTFHIQDSMIITGMDLNGASGDLYIAPTDIEQGFVLNEYGMPTSGVVLDEQREMIYQFDYDDFEDAADFILYFNDPAIPDSVVDIGQLNLDFGSLSFAEKVEVINYYMLLNGIANQNPIGSPGYMINFKDTLAEADPSFNEQFNLIPLYNESFPIIGEAELGKVVDDYQNLYLYLQAAGYVNSDGRLTEEFYELDSGEDFFNLPSVFEEDREEIFNYLKDLTRSWIDDNINDKLRDMEKWVFHEEEVIQKILDGMDFGGETPVDITSMCYSGAAQPFITLINREATLDVKSLVLVGTPIRGTTTVTNTNVENVVYIIGEKDDGVKWYNKTAGDGLGRDPWHLFENSPVNLNEFAIELKGMDHGYFYDPDNPGDNAEYAELQQKATRFIAEVTYRANDKEELLQFLLDTEGISYDYTEDKYVVDLNRVNHD